MNNFPKIRLRGLYKSFGKKTVLSGIDLDVNANESLVIIGGSGSGKSVTLKCILGILKPDRGIVEVDGKSVLNMHEHDREKVNQKFGMLFQGGALFDSLRVWENVSFGLLAEKHCSREEAKEIAIEKLAHVGMDSEVAELFPAELSGGMQKRVGLARAIATDPEIIFFDEPTAGLDPIMADVINDLIVEITQKMGATTLSITHDMTSARKIAHRIAMLHEGKIIWVGSTQDVDSSGNPYVDQFIKGHAEGPIKMAIRD